MCDILVHTHTHTHTHTETAQICMPYRQAGGGYSHIAANSPLMIVLIATI